MYILKAGTILINPETKQIALIYRAKKQDYSFPKGHLEANETLKECALRETEEETGRKCFLKEELPLLTYLSDKGKKIEVHYYIAFDNGVSTRQFEADLVHQLIWTDITQVEKKLTYPSLIEYWKKILPLVAKKITLD